MRIGILTFHCVNNYGAILQAYALTSKIKDLGHIPEVIDFCPKYKTDPYHPFRWFRKYKNPLQNIYEIAATGYKSQKGKACKAFINSYLPLSKEKYVTENELIVKPPQYDAYIVGSDQVWNPELTGKRVNAIYYLDFVPKGRKKISYAASFGKSIQQGTSLSEEELQSILHHITDLDGISVRESEAKDWIFENSQRVVDHVVDPVLLMTAQEWITMLPKLKSPQERGRYILVYGMGLNKEVLYTAKKIAEYLKLPIVNIGKPLTGLNRYEKNYFTLGPEEFLNRLVHAEVVITNSYHGMALSLVFQKPFFVLAHKTRNSRIISLLSLFGLEKQMLHSSEEIDRKNYQERLYYNPDKVGTVQDQKVKEAVAFLKDSLGNTYE